MENVVDVKVAFLHGDFTDGKGKSLSRMLILCMKDIGVEHSTITVDSCLYYDWSAMGSWSSFCYVLGS